MSSSSNAHVVRNPVAEAPDLGPLAPLMALGGRSGS